MSDAEGVHIVRHARPVRRATSGQTALYTIVAIHNNYLECTDDAGDAANVARPALNRRDSHEGGGLAAGDMGGSRDGETITYTGAQTRTVTKGGAAWSPEEQTIGPTLYAIGDVVAAVEIAQTVEGDASGTVACTALALDARCWGTLPEAD